MFGARSSGARKGASAATGNYILGRRKTFPEVEADPPGGGIAHPMFSESCSADAGIDTRRLAS